MSGMKTAVALLAVLTAALVFSACGKKKEEPVPEVTESVATSADVLQETMVVETPAVDPNESYAAQVQAELGDVEIPTTDVTTMTGTIEVPALSQTISTPDGGSQLKVPGTWIDLKGQIDASGAMDGYLVQVGSTGDAQFLVYTAEAKPEVENAPVTSIEEYSGWLVQYVTSASSPLQNAEVLTSSDIRLTQSTMDGKKTVLKGIYNGQEVVYFVYAIEGASSYHQFCCWAPAGLRNSSEATFDAVVNSFTVF